MSSTLIRSREEPLAFAEVYDNMSEKILRFFTRRTWDEQESHELTAETFAKAFEKRADFRGRSDREAAGWLWTIARNELSAHWRSHAARTAATLRLEPNTTHASEDLLRLEELLSAMDGRAALESALSKLQPSQREVIDLRILQELEYEEIAERLGVSNQVVRTRLSRGLRSLERMPGLRETLTGASSGGRLSGNGAKQRELALAAPRASGRRAAA
ncbi:MAG TPA: RNA polymerase sigma factor [Solirubrobacteraceae bacterium]|jgi:RNA polymerase sigma-70 factor (ECF subfamily)|nr:RNA polymerase sigma factor [Solirubrobacteraceae bacterium]